MKRTRPTPVNSHAAAREEGLMGQFQAAHERVISVTPHRIQAGHSQSVSSLA